MGKVLIIGAGGVGTVVAHKVAQNPDVFTDIMIASRTKSKCDAIVKAIGNPALSILIFSARTGAAWGRENCSSFLTGTTRRWCCVRI